MPENKLNDEKVLRMFVDRLIADKGGDTLDAKQKEILQKELFEELDERIQQAMIRALTDAKLVELEKLLDEDAPDEEIESFFKGAGVDFDPAIRKALDEFRTDYFKDKIRVSVKTSILETVPKAPVVAAAPEVKAVETAPAAGQPAQGTSSVAPGQSNVEGVANATSAAEQGQAPVAQPQVVAQGANVTSSASVTPSAVVPGATPSTNTVPGLEGMPSVTPFVSTSQTVPAAPATPVVPVSVAPASPAVPAEPVASAASANPVAPVATPATPTVPVAKAAPEAPAAEQPLQVAPNLMDALNTATADLDTATANLNVTTNTDTTGKEA